MDLQSALAPAGQGAEQIARLFHVMAWGAAAIWAAVTVLSLYAVRGKARLRTERQIRLFLVGGGILFPAVVLTGLLTYGLSMLPAMLAAAPPGSLRIEVTGEQWWWRMRYPLPDGGSFEHANEIRLPAGETIELVLTSADVIHSLWIPSLAGKMDMIPGRTTRLVLSPTREGTYRGLCAELCGASHALMAFDVVVMPRAAFDAWREEQARPARAATADSDAAAVRGSELFAHYGCTACHTVRGVSARGVIGPDLTHVAGRRSIAAGTIPLIRRSEPASAERDRTFARASFQRWIVAAEHIKPGVHMPSFDMIPPDDAAALAAYLESLR